MDTLWIKYTLSMGVRNKNAFIIAFRNEDNVLDKIYKKQIRDIKENAYLK